MKKNEELKSLSDEELLRRLSDVLKQSRCLESELVASSREKEKDHFARKKITFCLTAFSKPLERNRARDL